jgi:hypothetical protein
VRESTPEQVAARSTPRRPGPICCSTARPTATPRGAFPDGIDQQEALRRFHSFYGHPDEIIAALQQEKVLPVATDLITQFNPAVPDHDAAIRALELIATEVAPALGWQPARDFAEASALTGA